jgi:hypothetical protein
VCAASTQPDGLNAQARYDVVYNTEGGMAIKKEAAGKEDRQDSKRVKTEKS